MKLIVVEKGVRETLLVLVSSLRYPHLMDILLVVVLINADENQGIHVIDEVGDYILDPGYGCYCK